MKKVRVICLLMSLLLFLSIMSGAVLAQPDASVGSGSHSVDAQKPLDGSEKLLDTAKAVVLYERNSDTMIYTYEPDKKVDPSSMAKLMTALIAIENLDMNATATVSRSALNDVGIGVVSVKPRFSPGEEVSVEALLYCMIAASDSDSAAVLAEMISGSQSAFVEKMNQRATEMGCTNTNFTNAHGLYDENAYSTARDICRIIDIALENEQFLKVFTADTYTVPATNKADARQVLTTNWMMSKDYTKRYFDERVIGGKTGTDGQNGRCLAVTAEAGGMELLAVVMGAEAVYNEEDPNILEAFGSFEEMKALLDYASGKFEYRQVFHKNQTFSQYPVVNGSNNLVTTPASEAYAILPIELAPEQLRWVYPDTVGTITAPVQAGQKITHVEVWYGDLCIAQSDLLAMNAVDVYVPQVEPDMPAALHEDSAGRLIAIVAGILLGILVLGFAVLFVIRTVRIAAMRAKRRRRRMNRRRSY
ncbi:MAG: D-alanyl-D-alanine carboxypeptidase [Oscillospiraceae bacterium]|nr:D-alanyl-D-alanine carboxypeptidase [Oscillospiraceae bacterium]